MSTITKKLVGLEILGKGVGFCFLMIVFLYNLQANARENIPVNESKRLLYGIIIPLEDESLFLQKSISNIKTVTIEGLTYYTGKIKNKDIIFVNSGLGKTNASIIATRLIRDFHPDLILLSGSSGNINPAVKKGDVVIGKNVIDADFGRLTANGTQFQYNQYLQNPQTKTELPLVFNLDSRLIAPIAHLNRQDSPKIILGKIATSDALPNPASQIKLLQEAKFDVIEMEGSSLMQTCWMFHTPCVVIRGVSNNVEESITKQDIQLAADNAAKVLINVISAY